MNKDQTNVVQIFSNWLADKGLYSPLRLEKDQASGLASYINLLGIQLDCHCPLCQKLTTFQYKTSVKLLPQPSPSPGGIRLGPPFDATEQFLEKVLNDVTFLCARNISHTFRAVITVERNRENGQFKLTKIGQLPSKLDLVDAKLRKYAKHAPEDAHELNKASICTSSGFHIAAFTYLRRVFERRLENAHDLASKDDDWDETIYDKVRLSMEGRISALKDHLPDFLVENRKIYTILSKGIHELEEQECADAYSTMEVGITLILDEEIAKKDRAAKLAVVSKDLQKLGEKYQ